MTKGWDRLSIELNTRPVRVERDVSGRDLLVPSIPDRLLLLGACLVCGACMSFLWVWFPALAISIVLDAELGVWLWVSMAVVALVGGLVLFWIAAARERGYPETL